MITWAYVAGFCDGEGTICRSYIRMYQKDPTPLVKIAEWLLSRGIYCSVTCRKTPRITNFLVVNQESTLCINRQQDMLKFIEGTLPYLLVKKVAAQDVRRYMKLFPASQKVNGFLGNEHLAAGARNRNNLRDAETGQYVRHA